MKRIEILVRPNGSTSVETKGFSGSECQQASRFLEQALGRRTKEQLTSEFYAGQQQQEPTREQA